MLSVLSGVYGAAPVVWRCSSSEWKCSCQWLYCFASLSAIRQAVWNLIKAGYRNDPRERTLVSETYLLKGIACKQIAAS
ncbi:MAG: hypothetical protein BGO09_13340 [Bacteroidetes bacterium 47-18]|nr:MAG: hypothetical protein BGO09_13340 [Bacteroidetes bacterium 47-18]